MFEYYTVEADLLIKVGGWGKGYVKIPKDHWLYGYHYTDLYNFNFNVEITFSKPENQFNLFWLYGFHTSYTWNNWNRNRVEEETRNLAIQLWNLKQPESQKMNHIEHCEGCGNYQIFCYC